MDSPQDDLGIILHLWSGTGPKTDIRLFDTFKFSDSLFLKVILVGGKKITRFYIHQAVLLSRNRSIDRSPADEEQCQEFPTTLQPETND